MSASAGPDLVYEGLSLYLNAASDRSYSPNVHPNPTDLYSWVQGGNACTLSRDNISSPVGSTPLKMVQTGNDPYTNSYQATQWNLAPAVAGETWTVSVWVKASATTTIDGIFLFEANSSGIFTTLSAGPNPTIGTEWQRIQLTRTFDNATTAFVQVRLDGTASGGSGITVWWDGLQVEKSSSATDFNPNTNINGNTWNDLSGNGNNGTMINGATYNSSGVESIVFDGVNDAISLQTITPTSGVTFSAWIYINGANSNYGAIFSNWGAGGNAYFISTQNGVSSSIQVYFAGALRSTITSLSLNTWMFLTITHTTNTAVGYINGVQRFSVSSALASATNVTSIGYDISRSNYPFKGSISNAQIHNRALSANEVKQNFYALRGPYGI